MNTVQKYLVLTLLMILSLHIPSVIYDWYYNVWWIDTPLHILGGLWLGFLLFYILQKQNLESLFFKNKNLSKENLIFVFLYLGFIIIIGVFWEYYEFTVDVLILKKYPYNLEPGYILFDTLKDLFNDLIGGLLSLIIILKIIKK